MMKYKALVFTVTIVIIFILGLIAHLQYFQTKRHITEFYSQKQMTLAHQASIGLQAFVATRIRAVEVLAEQPSARNFNQQEILAELERTHQKVPGFEFLILVDHRGVPQTGYPGNFPCIDRQPQEVQQQFHHALETVKRGHEAIIFSKNVAINNLVFVCLIAPIYSNHNEFRGAILGVLHIDDALQEALKPIFKGKNDYVWLLNEQGYLLYHPLHEEMLLRNVIKSEPGCLECHRKFAFEQQMLATEIGVGIKQNRNAPKVMIGYARVPLKNTNWVVAVSSPFSNLLASIRHQFISFLLLVIFMMLAIVIGAVLISRINNKLILAKMERDQEQQRHLAIIGAMAARIAHEIKNPLASIQTGIQLLESQLHNGEKQKSYYERLRGEIQRVDKILKGLLTYAKEDHLDARLTDIAPLIRRFEELIAPTLDKQGLRLETHLEPNLPLVLMDEQKIEQVLWNVTLNATQASQEGGQIFLDVAWDRDGLDIRIRDQGAGIAEPDLKKIFQPFFSTKAHGSGLGLAISKKIVELHRGQISIESQPEHGTTVIIHLPKGEVS